MRKFSPKEQVIIRNLVNQAGSSLSYVLANAYNDIFYRHKVEYNNGFLIFYSEDISKITADDILAVEKEIIDTSFLLDFLKENRYIHIIDDDSQDQLDSIGGFFKDGLESISKKLDAKTSEIIVEALNHRVFISEDLVQLVNNDFKTIEEMALDEAREQTKYSRKSVRYAFIAIILSIIMPFLSSLLSSNVVKLDSKQYEQLYNCCADYEKDVDMTYHRQTDTVMEVIYIDTCIKH